MKRKRVLIFLLVLLVVALAAWAASLIVKRGSAPQAELHRPGYSQSPGDAGGNTTPTGAVIGLVEALRDWDMGLAAQWMLDAPENTFTEAYHQVLAPVLSRVEFEVGGEKIAGDAAWVDVSVTAVDVGAALGDLSADATTYLVSCITNETEVDWQLFLADYLSNLNAAELVRVRRDATVHLKLDSGGKWRVDLADEDNAPFLDALTGGLPQLLLRLQTLHRSVV